MMARLVKAPLGVESNEDLQKDYQLHMQRRKVVQKFTENGKLKKSVFEAMARTFQIPPGDAGTSPKLVEKDLL